MTLKKQITTCRIELKYSEIRQAFENIINGVEYDVIMEEKISSFSVAQDLIRVLIKILEED